MSPKTNIRKAAGKKAARSSGGSGRPGSKAKRERPASRRGGTGRPPIRAVINRLEKAYPASQIALDFGNPHELLVATILAAQCTDARVNQVTVTLFKRFKTPADYARAPVEEIMEIVRPTGFFRNKSKSIKGACGKIVSDFGGEVPRTMEELLTLPGVARKTANIVLGDAFGLSEGIAVDTHMLRLSRRLGLTVEKDPVKVERDLCAVVPRKKWLHLPHLIADHGRAVCKARVPLCDSCVLAKLCPSKA
jgi:endonuclease-3